MPGESAIIAEHISATLTALVQHIDWTETIRSVLTAVFGGVGGHILSMRKGGRVVESRLNQDRQEQTRETARALEMADDRADHLSERIARLEGALHYTGATEHDDRSRLLRQIKELQRDLIDARASRSDRAASDGEDPPDESARS